MGRAKLNLELIHKEKSRSITFQKRKKGLAKKIYEFKTLCDVRACMIIYGPNQRSGSAPVQPEIWPPDDPEEVRQVILQYRSKSNEERMRRTTDLNDFYKDRKKKLDAELTKVRRRIGASRFPPWDPCLDALTQDQLAHLGADLDGKIQEAKERLDLVKGKHHSHYHHHYPYGGGDHIHGDGFMDASSSLIPTYQFNKSNGAGVTAAAGMMDFSQSLLPLPMTHGMYNSGVVEHYEAKPHHQYYPSIEIHAPQQAAPTYAVPPIQQLPPLDVGYGYGSWFGDGASGGSSSGVGGGNSSGGGILAGGFQYPQWKATGPQYYGDQMGLLDSFNEN